MKASEGKLGRVFFLRLDDSDSAETIQRFAAEKGIQAALVSLMGSQTLHAMLAPDPSGSPGLHLPDHSNPNWQNGEVVLQELLGFTLQRVRDPASGEETLARVISPKTRVLQKSAPAPEEAGPGSIPVYLFNAEFN